jgi:cell division septal protein FtsQ
MKQRVLKRHLNVKRFLIFILIIGIAVYTGYYFLHLKIAQIEIIGTTYLTDNEIIDAAKIKDYPPIFSLKNINMANDIKSLPLVSSVKISKTIWGKLTIKINEAKVLFLNKNNNKIILSNGQEITPDKRFLGIPTLINYVPDDIYNDLITGLTKVDDNVLKMISEIEYNPSKASDGEVIDNTRFLLRMNDTNTVYMNTINITQLNKYIEICSAIISQNDVHGILYLDSSTEENYSFEAYGSGANNDANKQS